MLDRLKVVESSLAGLWTSINSLQIKGWCLDGDMYFYKLNNGGYVFVHWMVFDQDGSCEMSAELK